MSGMLTFERFLAGVRLSLQERRGDVTVAQLQRARSEGKLDYGSNSHVTCTRKAFPFRQGPTMGLSGRLPGKHQATAGLQQHDFPHVDHNARMNTAGPEGQARTQPRQTTASHSATAIVMRPKQVWVGSSSCILHSTPIFHTIR